MLSLKHTRIVDDNYQQPNEKETAWYNIIQASKTHDLNLVVVCVGGWYKANPDKNHTDLENKLRDADLDIYLIASKYDNISDDFKLVSPFDYTSECEYVLLYSCRPKEQALKEVLTHASSYEENFNKLNSSGALITKSFIKDNIPDPTKKPYEDNDLNTLIQNNYVKIELVSESMEDKVNKDIEQAQKHFKKKIDSRLIGMAPDGSGVMGFFINDKLISDIGHMCGFDKSGIQHIKLILINNKDTWTGFMERDDIEKNRAAAAAAAEKHN